MKPDADVVVVGGGPVGLVAALHARRLGLSVVLLEPRAPGIDKACGEGLMPSGLAELISLGVDPPGRPIAGIGYHDQAGRVAQARFGDQPGRGVRRTVLQKTLHAAARDAGVDIVGRAADGIRADLDGVVAAGVRGRYLVAADGLHSPIRRSLGLIDGRQSRAPARYGLRRHVAIAPWTDLVEVHWGKDAECYITGVDESTVGIAMLTAQRGRSWESWLQAFPAVAERVLGAPVASSDRGAGPLRQSSQRRVNGRVLLVGDAAGYVDALTGEGLAVGFASAREAARAIAADDPRSYEAAWRRVTRTSRLLTRSLLVVTATRTGRAAVVPAARALPRVFDSVVSALA